MDENCIFCKIARGDFGTEFVAESENALAFDDIAPQSPVHVLVIPKRHIVGLHDLDDPALAGELITLARMVAEKKGVTESGFRLVANDGADSGQEVFHLHFHVMGGRKLGRIASKERNG